MESTTTTAGTISTTVVQLHEHAQINSKWSGHVADIICGSVAGATGKLIEYPFDTIKVRLQSQLEVVQFRGPLDCLVQSLKAEGVMGLYRGISSPIIGAAAENASLFMTYNILQDLLKGVDVGSFQLSLMCGAGSGAFTSYILTPIELVKCKIQVQSLPQYSSAKVGALRLIADVYRTEGMVGFWRGQTGTLIRESGGSASWFGAYEYVGHLLRKRNNRDTNTSGEAMIAGAAAGVSYNLSLFPADTIKSRMQTESVLGGSATSGFLATATSIYRTGGIKALYRGCGVTICRSAPSSAIIFLTYEKLKKFKESYS
jgi:ornithine carrier protein